MNQIVIEKVEAPVIIGAGIAGLLTALYMAPEPVVLLSKQPLMESTSSAWAQGGMAAAMGADDSASLHVADTLAAGAGLCDEAFTTAFAEAAPEAIRDLIRFGIGFDQDVQGRLELGLEAAHSRRRIVHAKGGATGNEIMRGLVAAVRRAPHIRVIEGFEARRVLTNANRVTGVVISRGDEQSVLETGRVVMATGGIGGLFEDSTNPLGSWGQGLGMAARAGAVVVDLEFIQFHPTALDAAARPMRLISEAVRGEGATLVDETGHRFLKDTPGAELAPRDVVARAIWRHRAEGHEVFLNVKPEGGENLMQRFPAIAEICRSAGVNPTSGLLPVRPAEHYHMGGIAVDREGQSSVSGLWACGEVAATGLHGANRLASNSLTEAAVAARWVAESMKGFTAPEAKLELAPVRLMTADLRPIRKIMSRSLNVLRTGAMLEWAVASLAPLAEEGKATCEPATIALMMAVAALNRRESRGGHFRSDYPETSAEAARAFYRLNDVLEEAQRITARGRTGTGV